MQAYPPRAGEEKGEGRGAGADLLLLVALHLVHLVVVLGLDEAAAAGRAAASLGAPARSPPFGIRVGKCRRYGCAQTASISARTSVLGMQSY